ncbi:MarR family winged helix-turn-helix transcriptional regulator [Vibrio crassostreae]|uniref:MarR family winged helix-turn-helix transcriptional regulator n=1 Tax=Vibrio crassostreae TaxID=246167 RepID=UPI001B30C45C|nr:MarR family winged helix-turn-helix transcriptional regulator [Vibrio crassostreae]
MSLHYAASQSFKKQISAFREKVHQEIHPMQMLVFLEVCNTPPLSVSVSQIQDTLGLTQASASRHCRMMTEQYSPSKTGYGLCEWVHSPTDFRAKFLKLTQKGKDLEAALSKLFKR